MPFRFHVSARPRAVRLLAAGLLAATTFTPYRHVLAQAVTGAGADATPVPRGSVRIRLAGIWDQHDRVYAGDSSRPLLSTLATGSLGVAAMPQLTAAQQGIRTLSGLTNFNLSLGPLEAFGNARQSVTPIALDVGITSRLSIGIVVPYVETRNNAQLILNRDGTGATVGQNPAYSSTGGSAARAANGAVLRQLLEAQTQLNSEITRCASVNATNCDAIRANPAGAQQALQQALETQNAIATVYGDSVRGGAPLVPISSSSTQTAINTRLGTLRTTLESFGITSLTAGTLPASATVINGPAAPPRIANDTAYGLNYNVLGGTRRAGIGDIDLSASFLWFNTLGTRPAQWLTGNTRGIRSMATVGWRFGIASADRTDDAFDVPIGDGANAILLRSTTDLVLSRKLWMSGTIRVVQPTADQVAMRRPLFDEALLFAPSVVGVAQRTLGRRSEIEFAPRLVIGQFFGVSGGYVYRRIEEDSYAFAAQDTLPAATFRVPTRSTQAYLLGVTFSTMSSYIRGRSKWPVEVLYTHSEPVSGSGGVIPAVSSDRLELRVYTGFPRR